MSSSSLFRIRGKGRMTKVYQTTKLNLFYRRLAARPAGNEQKNRTAFMIQSAELKRARNDMTRT